MALVKAARGVQGENRVFREAFDMLLVEYVANLPPRGQERFAAKVQLVKSLAENGSLKALMAAHDKILPRRLVGYVR